MNRRHRLLTRETRESDTVPVFARMPWRGMSKTSLERLLKALLIAEFRAHPTIRKGRWGVSVHHRGRARIRWRRRQIAQKYLALGGRVDQAVLGHSLPKGSKWPGAAFLVEPHSKGSEN